MFLTTFLSWPLSVKNMLHTRVHENSKRSSIAAPGVLFDSPSGTETQEVALVLIHILLLLIFVYVL